MHPNVGQAPVAGQQNQVDTGNVAQPMQPNLQQPQGNYQNQPNQQQQGNYQNQQERSSPNQPNQQQQQQQANYQNQPNQQQQANIQNPPNAQPNYQAHQNQIPNDINKNVQH